MNSSENTLSTLHNAETSELLRFLLSHDVQTPLTEMSEIPKKNI